MTEETAPVLALDIGGTRIKAAVVHGAAVSDLQAVESDEQDGAAGVLAAVLNLARGLAAVHRPVAAAACVRGIVDPARGVLLDVNEPLRSLIGLPLADTLSRDLGLPVHMENDARMHALGELLYGAGRGSANMVLLTLGTGVGTGVAIGGRLLRGPRGVGGILSGHMTVQADGPRCGCGNVGCLDALIGTAALLQHAAQAGMQGLAPGDRDSRPIFAAAAAGLPAAAVAVDRFARLLGAGIVSLIHAYDPEVVVLGGGTMRAGDQFLPAVREYVHAHAWTLPRGRVPLLPAALGDGAALVGLAALAGGADLFW